MVARIIKILIDVVLKNRVNIVLTKNKNYQVKDAVIVHSIDELLEELKSYKEAEEQELLVRLPCKVGDIIWDNDFGYPQSYEIKAFSYGFCDSYVEPDIEDQIIFYYENYIGSITGVFPMSEIGKTVFLTREDAEKKLEEMKK